MTPPFRSIRRLAQRACEPATLERLIDPILADIDHERAVAIQQGRPWRAAFVQVAGGIELLKAVVLHAAIDPAIGRAWFAALTGFAAVTLLIVAQQMLFISRIGATWELFVYLLPGACAISVPVGFGIGALCRPGDELAGRSWRITMAVAGACAVATFLNTGWLTPEANQRFRTIVAGHPVSRGANELTFGEVRYRLRDWPAEDTSGRGIPLVFWYHSRLAVSASPIVLAGFVLTSGIIRRRWLRRWSVAFGFLFYLSCYIALPPTALPPMFRWLHPIIVAWFPNLVLTMFALVMRARGRPRELGVSASDCE